MLHTENSMLSIKLRLLSDAHLANLNWNIKIDLGSWFVSIFELIYDNDFGVDYVVKSMMRYSRRADGTDAMSNVCNFPISEFLWVLVS